MGEDDPVGGLTASRLLAWGTPKGVFKKSSGGRLGYASPLLPSCSPSELVPLETQA